MTLRGLTTEEAQTLAEPDRAPVVLDRDAYGWDSDVLSLLRWDRAKRIELAVRERILPASEQAWWGGSEGFVFGLDVRVDGLRRDDLSKGQLLLKVLSSGGISEAAEGRARAERCAFLCGRRMNLHLRLQSHPTNDRLLFAGAPILSFQHDLGLAEDGAAFVCYVMRNAGIPPARRIVQWRQLREERILTARERIWLAHDLARCVLTLEGLGLAHGDLSPENALVRLPDRRTERPTLALVDFDLFHACAPECPRLAIHEPPPTGGAPGHDGYLPPDGLTLHDIVHDEPGRGNLRYDRFALAILIFEILTWCDTAWEQPLIPQSVLDAIPEAGESDRPRETLAPLGPLAWLLGPSVRELLGRALSRDFARWPGPNEWINVLESPGIYQVCLSPMRSLLPADRRKRLCAFPLPAAFRDHVRRLGVRDRAGLAERSAMRRGALGWRFRDTVPVANVARSKTAGTAQPVPAWVHFHWLGQDGAAASDLLARHIGGLSFCPVCGERLSIGGEIPR